MAVGSSCAAGCENVRVRVRGQSTRIRLTLPRAGDDCGSFHGGIEDRRESESGERDLKPEPRELGSSVFSFLVFARFQRGHGLAEVSVAEQLVFGQSCALKVSEDLSPKSGKVVAIKIYHRRRLQRSSVADHVRDMT